MRFKAPLLALSLGLLAAAPSVASEPEPLPFMDGLGFSYEGNVGGLHAWSLPESEELWLVLPDGRHVVGGYLFNQHGRDVGSVILGIEPIDALESLGLAGGLPDNGDDGADPVTLAEMEEMIPSAIEQSATDLAGLSASERDALVAELVSGMAAATTPEEFRMAIVEWQARVTGAPLQLEAVGSTDREVAPTTEAPSTPAVLSEAGSAGSDIDLLNEIRTDLFWFSVGEVSAPTVYMFYDPSCPYCARSIRNLEPRLESGDLQLRIILAPMLSSRSIEMASSILSAEEPVAAFLENALSQARFGSSSIEPVSPEALDPAYLVAMEGNIDFMRNYQIRGVPFFAWMTEEGPRFLSGVPARDYAFDATRDDYDGTR